MTIKSKKTRLKRNKLKVKFKSKANSKKIITRQSEVKKRKSFLPSFILTICLWGLVFGLLYFSDPSDAGTIPLFLGILFSAILLTFSIIFANTRRGIITSSAVIIFLTLRMFGIGNILNLVLIVGMAITIEYYFWRSKS